MLPCKKKGLFRCNKVKDLEMERASLIIQVGPKCNYMYPYKKETTYRIKSDIKTEQREI